MTATEIVKAAKEAAPWIRRNRHRVMGGAIGYVLTDGTPGVTRKDHALDSISVMLRCDLDAPELVAARHAGDDEPFVRALLESAKIACPACGHEDEHHDAAGCVERHVSYDSMGGAVDGSWCGCPLAVKIDALLATETTEALSRRGGA